MKEIRPLLGNVSALFIIQVASYVLPLILIPYLTRTIGVKGYGLVAFGLAYVAISGIVIDFGFDLYAPYALANHRDNVVFVRKFAGAVFLCKSLLLLGMILITVLFALSPVANKYEPSYILLFIAPIVGAAFQPIWFYQAIERMKTITVCYVFSRILYIALVLVLVKKPADTKWVIFSFGIAQIAGAVLGIGLMISAGYRPLRPSSKEFKAIFIGASHYFYSRAAAATYSAGGGLFLGLVSTQAQVAYFSVAEQLFRAGQGLYSPILQALYPYMARFRNLRIYYMVLSLSIITCMLGLIVGVLFGKVIIAHVFGGDFQESYKPLIIFLVVLIINVPSSLIGYPLLGAFGYGGLVNKSVISAGIVQLALLSLMYAFNLTGAVDVGVSVLIAELAVLLVRLKGIAKFGLAPPWLYGRFRFR